jgi:hypothetical protein
MEVPLRGPSPGEIGEHLEAVQRWAEGLERGAGSSSRRAYELEWRSVGGRVVGRNEIPSRAHLASYDQAWRLLGVAEEVAAFEEALTLTRDVAAARDWVLAHPLRAVEIGPAWPQVLAAYDWLVAYRGRDHYLREIDAPGVDTKVVERHRPLLAALLGLEGSRDFAAQAGFRGKPATLRMRFAEGFLGLPRSVSEATFRVEEIAAARVSVASAVVVENEITFLSVPVPTEGVVVWGQGFHVDRVGSVPWLRDCPVRYWGDLDTHGFAILDRLRARLPQAESLLMDRETLLAHRERWVAESSPTRATLRHLTPAEKTLYADLVSDLYAERVRLEQERIVWGYAMERWPQE